MKDQLTHLYHEQLKLQGGASEIASCGILKAIDVGLANNSIDNLKTEFGKRVKE